MPRCCGGSTCSCVIQAGEGTEITGIGSANDPYVIALDPEQNELAGEQIWTDVNFTGGVVAGISGTPVAIGGLAAYVPPSTRPQIIRFAAPFVISVTGGGYFTLQLYDTTTGSASLKKYAQERMESTTPVNPGGAGDVVTGFYRLAPHTDYRMFQVYFTLGRDGGSSLQVGVPNLGLESTKSILEVERV